jgi:PDZ domain-containing protein
LLEGPSRYDRLELNAVGLAPESLPVRRPRWAVFAAWAMFVGAGLALASWNLRLPFYAYSSGPVGDAITSVKVSEVETYDADGELIMLTVSSQEVNPFEALVAGFDPDVDLVPREAVRPLDESVEDFVARNRATMDLSRETAIALGLTRLGYQVVTRSDGVLVAELVEGAPAASVLEVDDVITMVEGETVELADQIGPIVSERQVGDVIVLTVKRGDEVLDLDVTLTGRDDDPAVPMIGISAIALNPRFEYPFPIDIDAGLVGGPSAGLMYTLAVMEVLAPDDLTHGYVVAGTGTIDSAGNVGPIGGVRQKVVAAEAAGADVMLVPESNLEEALTARRQDLEIIPVATLDEALAALAAL